MKGRGHTRVFPGLSKGTRGIRKANLSPTRGDGRVVPKYTNKYSLYAQHHIPSKGE